MIGYGLRRDRQMRRVFEVQAIHPPPGKPQPENVQDGIGSETARDCRFGWCAIPRPKASTMIAPQTRAAGNQWIDGSRFPDPGEGRQPRPEECRSAQLTAAITRRPTDSAGCGVGGEGEPPRLRPSSSSFRIGWPFPPHLPRKSAGSTLFPESRTLTVH